MLNRFRFFVVEEVVVAALCDGCAVRARALFSCGWFFGAGQCCVYLSARWVKGSGGVRHGRVGMQRFGLLLSERYSRARASIVE